MRPFVGCALVPFFVAVSGCAATVDDPASSTPAMSGEEPAPGSPLVTPEPSIDDVLACTGAEGEGVGEACSALLGYSSTQLACIVAASMGCGGVSLVCGAGEVLTLGTVTIPARPPSSRRVGALPAQRLRASPRAAEEV